MADNLLQFIAKYLGVADVGTNPINSGQCVGLVEVYVDYFGKPRIPGNAKDLLDLADRRHYRMVENGPTNIPPPGAIVCWDATWGEGFGHCAIVVTAALMRLVVFEQNDPNGWPPLVATHSYGGVAGWLTF